MGCFLRYDFEEELVGVVKSAAEFSGMQRRKLASHRLGLRCGLGALIGIKLGIGASQ